jgi:hypothetical protein
LKEIPKPSSIRDSKEGLTLTSSLALELIVIVKFKASNNNQRPIDWFSTHALTTWLKESTIV